MSEIDGGQLFARALKKEGVEQVFTLTGGHIMPILYACRDEGIKIIDVRHESAGAYAADAYARVSGKPGVLITTAGPGVTHTVTAMAEARDSGVPVIHIGGASPVAENETGALQDMNTVEIMAATTKWSRKIYSTSRIPEYVGMAFRHAMDASPGPVYLEVAADTLSTVVGSKKVPFPEKYRTDALAFGDPILVEQAADYLLQAKRPVMIIGNAARFASQHGECLPKLAETLNMPVISQTMSRGLFIDEDLNPLFKFTGAIPICAEADVILLMDVTNDYMVFKCQLPMFNPETKLIQVNSDKSKIGYNAPAHLGIVGSTGPVASQLLEAVRARSPKKDDATWLTKASETAMAVAQEFITGFTSDELPMNPGRLAFEVSQFLKNEGRDHTLVIDGGDSAMWMNAASTAHRPGQILMYGPNGTIGIGAGFTLGAWAATGKPVLYFTGDGSFGFYAMEMDTFDRLGIPVVVVISNDSSWGLIKLAESLANADRMAGGPCALELSHMRAYEKIAAMWGGHGEKVTKPEEVIPAIKRGFASNKPAIINVEVDKVNMSPVTRSFGEFFGMA